MVKGVKKLHRKLVVPTVKLPGRQSRHRYRRDTSWRVRRHFHDHLRCLGEEDRRLRNGRSVMSLLRFLSGEDSGAYRIQPRRFEYRWD